MIQNTAHEPVSELLGHETWVCPPQGDKNIGVERLAGVVDCPQIDQVLADRDLRGCAGSIGPALGEIRRHHAGSRVLAPRDRPSKGRRRQEDFEARIGAALEFEGFEILDGTVRDSYGLAEVGAELRWPGGFQIKDNEVTLGAYLIARRFLPETEVIPLAADSLAISNQWEVGVNFGTRPNLTVWGLKTPRLGLAYRWGDGLSSYRLNFGFPF